MASFLSFSHRRLIAFNLEHAIFRLHHGKYVRVTVACRNLLRLATSMPGRV